MILEFSPEQMELVRSVRALGHDRLAGSARARERDPELFQESLAACADLGLLSIVEDADQDSSDVHVTLGLVCEELARFDLSVAMGVTSAGMRSMLLGHLRDSELAMRLRSAVRAGRLLLPIGLTEPDAGSDVSRMRTKANPVPGGVCLRGEKSALTGITFAEHFIVFAQEPEQRAGAFSAFLVPCRGTGISTGTYDDLGVRAISRGWASLDDVFVPDNHRVGQPGGALGLILGAFDYNKAALALMCVGAAAASLEDAIGCVKIRQSFGEPLASKQSVAFRVAEMTARLEMARWLCYRALRLRDLGRPHGTEAAMAKWWGPIVAREVIHDCLLLNGHVGYTSEAPHEQRLRDVIGIELGDGTADIQKLIVARGRLGRDFVRM